MVRPPQKTIQQALPIHSTHSQPGVLPIVPTVPTAAARTVPLHIRAAPTTVPETVSEHSGSTPKEWRAYANGGVRDDDERSREKTRKETAKFEELISTNSRTSSPPPPEKLLQLSPKKKSPKPSANTALLIDLFDEEDTLAAPATALPVTSTPQKAENTNGRLSYRETFSYVGKITGPVDRKEKGKGRGKCEMRGGEDRERGNFKGKGKGKGHKAAEQRGPAPVFNLLD